MNLEKQCTIFGKLLFFFAVYTLTIKYFLPIAGAIKDGVSWHEYIFFWDAWWIIHIAVGFGLVRMKKGVWRWAMLLTVAEIVIIVVKLALFVRTPYFDFWYLSWAMNKSLLLIYFMVLFVWLLKRQVREAL